MVKLKTKKTALLAVFLFGALQGTRTPEQIGKNRYIADFINLRFNFHFNFFLI
jgi:hypothetical protein